ncbi:MAG: glycosyltransferase family 2 protein [bacterium]
MRLWKRKSEEEVLEEDFTEDETPESKSDEWEADDTKEQAAIDEPLPELQTSWRQIAVLIPCYNTGQTILDVVTEAAQHAGSILCVNDGSTDDTADCIRKSGTETIGWARNRGKGHAITAGFRALWERSNWEVLITMDGDGQHMAEDIPYLVEAYEETGADIVVGTRDFSTPEIPMIRRWSNRRSSKWIGKKSGLPLSDFQCGFRLFTREAVCHLAPRLSGGKFELETSMLILADRLGLHITECPITTVYTKSASRSSSWRAFRDSRRIYRAVKKTLKECEHLLVEPE